MKNTSRTAGLSPDALRKLDLDFDDGPHAYGITLTVEVVRAAVGAPGPGSPTDDVGKRLEAVAAEFLKTDPKAQELARLVATRDEIARKHGAALAEAEAEGRKAKELVSLEAGPEAFDASDAAADRADRARRNAERYGQLVADADQKIAGLRLDVGTAQRRAVAQEFEGIRAGAKADLEALVLAFLSRDPARVLTTAWLCGGSHGEGYVRQFQTVRE